MHIVSLKNGYNIQVNKETAEEMKKAMKAKKELTILDKKGNVFTFNSASIEFVAFITN